MFLDKSELRSERVYPKTAKKLFNEYNGFVAVNKNEFKYLIDNITLKNNLLIAAGVVVLMLATLLFIRVYKNYRK